MRQGTRIPLLQPGEIMGRKTSNLVISAVNSFENMVLKREDPEGILISDQNAVIRIGSSGAGGGALSIGAYQVISHHDDYLTCQMWDGTTLGGVDIYIAKPPELRFSQTSEVTPRGTISYSTFDTTAQSRLADNSVDTETQYITPSYKLAATGYDNLAVIYAVSAVTPITVSSVAVTLIDLNIDGREWVAAL